MHKVSIKPEWSIRDDSGQVLAHRVLDLLADVQAHGSLSGACKVTGSSYRHAWNLIRQGESQLGMPLLNMERGKGSSLTPVAEKLVWAGHRITARLTPMLETLASELETELAKIMTAEKDILKVHASHGFAIEKLIELLVKQGHNVERRYVGSQESAASLYEGHCALAGFHIPLGEFEDLAFQHYAKWLDPQKSQIIHVAKRRQGLMVAQGNPLEIYGINDLTKPGVRFINRQPSSGTYFLLECFLKKAGIDPAKLHGFNQNEFTHAAVAAFVASGMADVGLGVETPSRRFHLDFVPLATERYFLVCNKADLVTPHLQAVLQILHSSEFKQSVNALAGYSAEHCGQVQTLQEAFPDSFDLRAPPAK